MSSRQQEKEARRQERLAREAEEKRRSDRNRRLQIVGGAVLGVALVAAVVIAVAASGGGSEKPKTTGQKNPEVKALPIPPRKTTDLFAAAKAAGCVVKTFPQQGRTHVTTTVNNYNSNPPTSGNHSPVPAEDGDYSGQATPAKENFVHTLEHGRIEFQYRPGTPPSVIGQMRTLFGEQNQYHDLLFQNNTGMPYEVAATAWTHLIGCKRVTPQMWDALRAFRVRYTDQAPEQIP